MVMDASSYAHWMLDQEARALLARLARVKPFVLSEPMVLAASLLPAAQIAIERFLAKGRRELKERVQDFLGWLHGDGGQASPEDVQRRFGIGAIEKRREFGFWRQFSTLDRKSGPPRSCEERAQARAFRARAHVRGSNLGEERSLAPTGSPLLTLDRKSGPPRSCEDDVFPPELGRIRTERRTGL